MNNYLRYISIALFMLAVSGFINFKHSKFDKVRRLRISNLHIEERLEIIQMIVKHLFINAWQILAIFLKIRFHLTW